MNGCAVGDSCVRSVMAERGDLGDIPEQGPWEEEDDEPAADDEPAEESRTNGDEMP